MLRDGYTYRKSKKDSQIKQIRRRKKDNFYLQFVSKITDKVTQRIKEKKRTDLSWKYLSSSCKNQSKQIVCLIITFQLRHRSIINRLLNYFAHC